MDNEWTKSEMQRIPGQLMFNGVTELKVGAENPDTAHSASLSLKTVHLLLALETITRNKWDLKIQVLWKARSDVPASCCKHMQLACHSLSSSSGNSISSPLCCLATTTQAGFHSSSGLRRAALLVSCTGMNPNYCTKKGFCFRRFSVSAGSI